MPKVTSSECTFNTLRHFSFEQFLTFNVLNCNKDFDKIQQRWVHKNCGLPWVPVATPSMLISMGYEQDKVHQGLVNPSRPRYNGRHFPNDIFKRIFLNENVWIGTKISLKFVPEDPINNIPALVQIMAWHQPGDKSLSEPMLISLVTYISVTRPQWVKLQLLGLDQNAGLCKSCIYLHHVNFQGPKKIWWIPP